MKNNMILIGYMGCGKSTIGRRLAKILDMPFIDTDAWIEEKEGVTISEIFAAQGENSFRDMETKCLKTLIEESDSEPDSVKDNDEGISEEVNGRKGSVISVGGGLPVREENQKLLRQLGQVFYLKAMPDTIFERIKGDTTRPLLQTENPLQKIKEMMLFRETKYQAAAQKVIVVDEKSIDQIVDEIIKLWQEN